LASCKDTVNELRLGQRVSSETGAYFDTFTVDWWFDGLTMTIAILSLPKDDFSDYGASIFLYFAVLHSQPADYAHNEKAQIQ